MSDSIYTTCDCKVKTQLEKCGEFKNERTQRIQHLPLVEKWEARNLWKILSRILLQSTQAYDKERKSNSAALFKMRYWYKESDTTMPGLWARNRKTKT